VFPEKICAHVSLRPVAEAGTNMHPGEVAENCENTCVGAVLEGGYASVADADGFA
jgi:hypothetical protein